MSNPFELSPELEHATKENPHTKIATNIRNFMGPFYHKHPTVGSKVLGLDTNGYCCPLGSGWCSALPCVYGFTNPNNDAPLSRAYNLARTQ